MSHDVLDMIRSFSMIALITAGLVWYAVALGRKEDRDTESGETAKRKSQKFPVAS